MKKCWIDWYLEQKQLVEEKRFAEPDESTCLTEWFYIEKNVGILSFLGNESLRLISSSSMTTKLIAKTAT